MKKLITTLLLLFILSACSSTDPTNEMNTFKNKYQNDRPSYEYIEKNLEGALSDYNYNNEDSYYYDSINEKSYETNSFLKVNYDSKTKETKVEYKQGQRGSYSFTLSYTIDSKDKPKDYNVVLLSEKVGDTTTKQDVINNFSFTKEQINEKIEKQMEPVYSSLTVNDGHMNETDKAYVRTITATGSKEKIIIVLNKDSNFGRTIYASEQK